MTSAQMQITFAHRPILKLACKSLLPLNKIKQKYLHHHFWQDRQTFFFYHFFLFSFNGRDFSFPRDSLSHHWYWQGRDTPPLTRGKRKIYSEPKHCVLDFHDFVTHLHNFNDYGIFGLIFLAMFPDDSFTPVWTKKESLQGKHPPGRVLFPLWGYSLFYVYS